jgi:hypothetical protein
VFLEEGGGYRIKIHIYFLFDPINGIYNQFSFAPKEYVFSLIVPEELNNYNDQFRYITCIEELASFMQMLERVLFLKILDVAQDIQGLDQLMNPEDDEILERRKISVFFYPQRIIAAHLANNPRFEKLVEEYSHVHYFGANEEFRVTQWPKLLIYLREEVKPLI